ncbi:MAG: hypothetical protein FWH11_05325 [Micrococcales bacterium]|nr:hypothetical protein [Micrococcales bacterium]
MYSTVLGRVSRSQAPRVLVNLDDSSVDVADLHRYFTENPMQGLEEVIVVRGGTVQQIYP